MESYSNQNSVKQIKIYFIFEILQSSHIMARTAQISKEKQQAILTLRHESQSIKNISITLKVTSSAVTKTIKRYDETGSHENHQSKGRPELTLRQRICSLQPK